MSSTLMSRSIRAFLLLALAVAFPETASARADLVVSQLLVATEPIAPGGVVHARIDVRNTGHSTADRSTVTVGLSTDEAIGEGDRLLSPTNEVGRLGPGNSERVVASPVVPEATPLGTYYVFACADTAGQVLEESEVNNCRRTPRPLIRVEACTDADGDALCDRWETDGVDVDEDGAIDLDLPGMGANPRHKDIFVELDFMPPHRLELAAGDEVAAAFADAPVTNPDGTPGITLHLDNGPDSVMNPRTGAFWVGRSRQSSIPHQSQLGSVAARVYDWGAFDALKTANFPPERAAVFHYAISGHAHDGTSSGIARDIGSSDLLLTLGAGCLANTGSDCTLDARSQAGTLMHELGHNLGLRHGGTDGLLKKPNYLSVMNYNFQLTGLIRADLSSVLDYSRFHIPLDETALDETHGLGVTSGPARAFQTIYECPSGAQKMRFVDDGPTDFNCDGSTSGTIAADISGDGNITPLPGAVDWPALVYAGGSIGGSGVALPAQTTLIEPPAEELLATKQFVEDYIATHQTQPVTPPVPVTPVTPGQPVNPATPPQPGTTPLAITTLDLRPSRFRAARRGPSTGRRGAEVTYTLSASTQVRFTIERVLRGRRRAGQCRPTKTAPGGRRCTRHVRVPGSFTHSARAGVNSFRFTGRLARTTLRPGRYTLTATTANHPATRSAPFSIRR
jgi:hypothetical protein